MEAYFDNSATTKPYKEVMDEMTECMIKYFANPSSIYSLGEKAKEKLNECRQAVASTLNCTSEEIIFTSGGSESNNFALKGFAKKGGHIITTLIEHSSILNAAKQLEKLDVDVTYLSVDKHGNIDLNELENSIRENTSLVSIMHVNNEIGVIQDIESIGRIIKEKNPKTLFHVDAVQSYGKLKIDVEKFKIDMLSASGHKIHGPRGVGIAYIRKDLKPEILISGGGQEMNFRSGTENLAGIAGFTKAAEIMNKNIEKNYEKVFNLKRYLVKELKEIPGIQINSGLGEGFLPHVVNVSAVGTRSGKILFYLDERGVYISKSSACSARKLKDSHVLLAIGLASEAIKGSFRISFCEENTKEEIDYLVRNIAQCLKELNDKGGNK